MRKRTWLLTVGLVIAAAASQGGYSQSKQPCNATVAATDEKFAPGQVWSFKSRDFEPNATLTVLKIESMGKIGVIVHVRLDGIRLRNCSGGPEPTNIEHAPFTREAIERSVDRLIRTGAVPDFEEGYSTWKKDCGGVYTITVAEMVVVDEKTFNNGSGCAA